ncbi:hypothetical protein SALBM311S_00790 [Streptomyces alboniger]
MVRQLLTLPGAGGTVGASESDVSFKSDRRQLPPELTAGTVNLLGIRALLVQGYVGKRAETDPLAEHKALMEETEYVIQADRSGFKYAWASEHHFLEVSHLSANDVYLGYLAHHRPCIHLGSGIFNPLAQVTTPRRSPRRSPCSTISPRTASSCSGRGRRRASGSIPGRSDPGRMDYTKGSNPAKGPSPSSRRCGSGPATSGSRATMAAPAEDNLPKPYGRSHPAMCTPPHPALDPWPPRKGLGVLGFSVQKVSHGSGSSSSTRTRSWTPS